MSQYTFKRPDSLILPQIYHRFQAKSRDSHDIVNYVIKDVPADRYEEAIEFMLKFFVGGEMVCTVAGLANRPLAVQEFRNLFKTNFNLKLSIACFCETNDELVAVNILKVLSKDDLKVDFMPKDEDFRAVLELFSAEKEKVDSFTMFNIDKYLWGAGLAVDTRYSRRGIATEILRARVPLMRLLGLKVTSTMFSGAGSQKAAKAANFREVHARSFEEIGKKFPQFDFSKCLTKELKIMVLEI